MSLEEGKTEYVLTKQGKCKYSKNGETISAISIDLHEPSMSHIGQYSKIKQIVSGLLFDMQQLAADADPELMAAGRELPKSHEIDQEEFEENARQLSEMLLFAFGKSDKPLNHFIDDFRKMAVNKVGNSICIVDGSQPMTDAIWNTLHPDDALGIALRWAAFFTMPSDFQGKKGSDEGLDSASQVTEL